VFAEPAAAAPWAAAKQLAGNGRIGKDETVVLLITGNGLKDVAALPASKPESVGVDFDIYD
jgi:threonine synthase